MSTNTAQPKPKKMAMQMNKSLESFDDDYTYEEFLQAASLLFRAQALKYGLPVGPTKEKNDN